MFVGMMNVRLMFESLKAWIILWSMGWGKAVMSGGKNITYKLGCIHSSLRGWLAGLSKTRTALKSQFSFQISFYFQSKTTFLNHSAKYSTCWPCFIICKANHQQVVLGLLSGFITEISDVSEEQSITELYFFGNKAVLSAFNACADLYPPSADNSEKASWFLQMQFLQTDM